MHLFIPNPNTFYTFIVVKGNAIHTFYVSKPEKKFFVYERIKEGGFTFLRLNTIGYAEYNAVVAK